MTLVVMTGPEPQRPGESSSYDEQQGWSGSQKGSDPQSVIEIIKVIQCS